VENPFATQGADSLNPYASPSAAASIAPDVAIIARPIEPRPVAADTIFNYAFQVWKNNLGLLVVIGITVLGANIAISAVQDYFEDFYRQQGDLQSVRMVIVAAQIVQNTFQLFLSIGQTQINLKLARRQHATYGELFGGLDLFLPILGASIIAYITIVAGLLCLIVPGILLVLAFWPFFYLIVDRKAGVFESFSVASRITKGNWGSSFVLWLMSMGIIILGCLALCIGLVFALPLISMMFAVAYLMMSGQLVAYEAYPGYVPAYPPPQPT
jgi:hypothetical protein